MILTLGSSVFIRDLDIDMHRTRNDNVKQIPHFILFKHRRIGHHLHEFQYRAYFPNKTSHLSMKIFNRTEISHEFLQIFLRPGIRFLGQYFMI